MIKSRDLSQVNVPFIHIGQFGEPSREFHQPRGICIDQTSDHIYIVDRLTRNVQICTINGDYVREFGGCDLNNPDSITLLNGYAFISNSEPSFILKYSLRDYSLDSKTDNVEHPFGISSNGNEVFVCETDSNRISVFDDHLSKQRILDSVRLSWCWTIQVVDDIIHALEVCQNCILKIHSISGHLIGKVVINQDGLSFHHAYYFSIDECSNYYITDYCNYIKILNPTGALIKSIDTSTLNCFLPRGIAITKNNLIVVVFRSGFYSLLVF